MILKIAEKVGLATVISKQPHGAKLHREKHLVQRLRKANPDAIKVLIVEIPGVEEERKLQEAGFEVVIIDHHRYGELDRMNDKSSLEQFLAHLEVNDQILKELGFNPRLVAGVAAMDRGFIWELQKSGFSEEEIEHVLAFYRELTLEVDGARRAKEEKAAEEAWKEHRIEGDVHIIESPDESISIRDALSYIVYREFGKPQTVLIKQGDRRIYVQYTDRAQELLDRFGGFTFGKDSCWGILSENGDLPAVEAVIETMKH